MPHVPHFLSEAGAVGVDAVRREWPKVGGWARSDGSAGCLPERGQREGQFPVGASLHLPGSGLVAVEGRKIPKTETPRAGNHLFLWEVFHNEWLDSE